MAADDHEALAQLQDRIDGARSDIADLTDRLESQVKSYLSRVPDLVAQLLSTAEEFGPAEALAQLRRRPADFGVSGPIQLATDDEAAIIRSMEKIIDAGDRLDLLATERDAALAAREPGHQRSYHAHGREFTIDWVDKKVRFLDRGREAERLALRVVEPRSGPKRTQSADRQRPRAETQPGPERPRGPTRSR